MWPYRPTYVVIKPLPICLLIVDQIRGRPHCREDMTLVGIVSIYVTAVKWSQQIIS